MTDLYFRFNNHSKINELKTNKIIANGSISIIELFKSQKPDISIGPGEKRYSKLNLVYPTQEIIRSVIAKYKTNFSTEAR